MKEAWEMRERQAVKEIVKMFFKATFGALKIIIFVFSGIAALLCIHKGLDVKAIFWLMLGMTVKLSWMAEDIMKIKEGRGSQR